MATTRREVVACFRVYEERGVRVVLTRGGAESADFTFRVQTRGNEGVFAPRPIWTTVKVSQSRTACMRMFKDIVAQLYEYTNT